MRWTEADLKSFYERQGRRHVAVSRGVALTPKPKERKASGENPIAERIAAMRTMIDKLERGLYRRIILRFDFDLNTALAKAKAGKGKHSYTSFKKRIEKKIIKQLENEADIPGRNHYLFDWYLKDARKDPDNIAAGKKVVFDSLCPPRTKRGSQRRKMIPNDSLKFIESFDDRFHLDPGNARVEITIVPS